MIRPSRKPLLEWLLATAASGCCLWLNLLVPAYSSPASITLSVDPSLRKAQASAQPIPLIDRQLFFQDPTLDNAQLSPDGRYLAFLKSVDGVMTLWVRGIDDSMAAAVPMTLPLPSPISFYRWSADGRYILYGQDQDGDENFQLYRVEPGQALMHPELPPEIKPLTPYQDIQAQIYAIPDETPEHIVVGINDRDPRFHDVYRLNLTTGARTLLFEGQAGIVDWMADHAGNLRLATRQTDEGKTEILVLYQGQLTPIYSCSLLETCAPISFHPDNQRVYVKTNRGEAVDLVQLVLLDLNSRAVTLVAQDPKSQVDLETTLFSSATHELLGTVYQDDRVRVEPLDAQLAANWDFLQRRFPDQDVYIGPLSAADRLALITVSSDINPGTVYLFDRQQQHLEKLYDLRPELDSQLLAPMQPLRYQARDGLMIPAYLTLPKQSAGQQLPAIIMPHGGPWGRDTWGYNPYVQFLANRGYAVLQPNFRGSAGYGQAFLNAGNQTWGTGAMQNDLTDGVYYLIDQDLVLADRIGIFGRSYGGYAALAGLTFTPDLYAAGVSLAGPANLLTLLAAIPPYWASRQALFAVRLGDLANPADRLRLAAQSPLFAIANVQAPLLVIQGANDPRVPQREADQVVVALRDVGKPVEYLLAPNEGHEFRKAENLLAAMAALEQFLAEHLGGRFQAFIPPAVEQRLHQIRVDVETVKGLD